MTSKEIDEAIKKQEFINSFNNEWEGAIFPNEHIIKLYQQDKFIEFKNKLMREAAQQYDELNDKIPFDWKTIKKYLNIKTTCIIDTGEFTVDHIEGFFPCLYEANGVLIHKMNYGVNIMELDIPEKLCSILHEIELWENQNRRVPDETGEGDMVF